MTVVYDKSATLAGTDDGDGDSNLNVRLVIPASLLGAATGTQVRLTVLFGTACPTETGSIDAIYVGRAATSGHTYDFNGNQVQITFGGSGSINGSAASSQVSDWVTFGGGESYDVTKSLVIAYHQANGSVSSVSVATIANDTLDYDFGASNAATSVVTLANHSVDTAAFIAKVEIQAVAAGTSPPIRGPFDTRDHQPMVAQ